MKKIYKKYSILMVSDFKYFWKITSKTWYRDLYSFSFSLGTLWKAKRVWRLKTPIKISTIKKHTENYYTDKIMSVLSSPWMPKIKEKNLNLPTLRFVSSKEKK